MMQETMEKRANRTVGKSRQKDFFAVLLFFFLLPYTCSSVVRAGQEKTVPKTRLFHLFLAPYMGVFTSFYL